MTRSMNHSPAHGLHIRRILLHPDISNAVLSCPISGDQKKSCEKNPLVIRRTYDITAACTRQNADADEAAISMHVRGDRVTPLLRCAACAVYPQRLFSFLGRSAMRRPGLAPKPQARDKTKLSP